MDREQRGRIVRRTWVEWALDQPNPKPSWLLPWEELDDGQREVDMRIGDELTRAERSRILDRLAARWPGTAREAINELIG